MPVAETMHDCYLSQFRCLKELLQNRKDILEQFVAFVKPKEPDRVYLLGSGTSRNACAAAAPFMESCLGVEVTPILPTSMGKLHGKRPLVVAVSQSGRSTNTIAAIQSVRAAGIPVVTLTDPAETPVGEAGDLPVHLAAQNELIGPRTRGYTATVLTLYLMALEAGLALGTVKPAAYDKAIAAFADTFAREDAYYAACQDFYDRHHSALRRARKYIFTGKGTAARVAEECALKVLETVCYPAIGYEYEEFLHGPVCFADEELAVFLFLPDDADRERMLKTANLLGNITENVFIIRQDVSVGNGHTLALPSDTPEVSSVFAFVLFGQLISARLTEDMQRKRHPGVKDVFANMDTKTPSGA